MDIKAIQTDYYKTGPMTDFVALNTDYYQLSMAMAYIMNDKANEITGFEGFIRHIKSAVNPSKNQFYIFDGETQIIEYIETLRKEIKDPEFKEVFIRLIEPKITAPNKAEIIAEFREKWDELDFDFEYTVVPNGSIVFPLVPVFQYKGPKIWGQIIETFATNTYNGRTGLATIKYLRDNGNFNMVSDEEIDFLERLMDGEDFAMTEYREMLEDTAKEFRESTDKILLEAAFRRCPSKATADMASEVAIKNGWDGTSNVSLRLQDKITDAQIGGTMAHAFVMSFEDERDAFIAWDKIFPGTTMLIDTYDVVNAAEMIRDMVRNNVITAPKEVRIDSDPLDEYSIKVDEIFNETFESRSVSRMIYGPPISNFVSGDMSVEKFDNFKFNKIPFGKAMAGTKYVYDNMIVEKLNSGFVYKIVEFVNANGDIIRPQKKSNGKGNYPGIKQCSYNAVKNELTVWCGTVDGTFGFNGMENMNADTKVVFVGGHK